MAKPRKPTSLVDHYAILGVPKNATPATIQKAFRTLAGQCHPDVNPSPLAEHRFKQLVDSYQVLKNLEKRNDLDAAIISHFCRAIAMDFFHQEERDPFLNSREMLDALAGQLALEEVTPRQEIRGVLLAGQHKFRQFLFVGPPASGKSTIIEKLRGWPEEGTLDLTKAHWWTDQQLNLRPRELHLGLPFQGFPTGMTAFAEPILMAESPPELEMGRLRIPPERGGFLGTRWRSRYVFDFLLPEPEVLLERQTARAPRQSHPADRFASPHVVHRQWRWFDTVARYLHLNGLPVVVRRGWDSPPMRFVTPTQWHDTP